MAARSQSSGADRSRRWRERRRKCRSVYLATIPDDGLSVLVAARFLAEDKADDREAVSRALSDLLAVTLERLRDEIISQRVSSGLL